MFYLISTAVDLDAVLRPFSMERAYEGRGVIDENHGVRDIRISAQLGAIFSVDRKLSRRNTEQMRYVRSQDRLKRTANPRRGTPYLFLIDRVSIRTFAVS